LEAETKYFKSKFDSKLNSVEKLWKNWNSLCSASSKNSKKIGLFLSVDRVVSSLSIGNEPVSLLCAKNGCGDPDTLMMWWVEWSPGIACVRCIRRACTSVTCGKYGQTIVCGGYEWICHQSWRRSLFLITLGSLVTCYISSTSLRY